MTNPIIARAQIEAIAAHLRDELGDDEQAFLDTLEGETDLFEIASRMLAEIEDAETMADSIGGQIQARQGRKNRLMARADTLRQSLMAFMTAAKVDKLPLPEATVSLRTNPPKIVVTDPEKVPDEFCKITRRPDMAAIKAAGVVEGTAMDNGGQSITIRRS